MITDETLFSLVKQERLARDRGDWATMAALYWPDSTVRVTWFTGTGEEFIEMSKARGRGDNGMHTINPVRCQRSGDRAVVESPGQILIRPHIDGVEVDLTAWCRFIARLERRDGEWRLTLFDSIYVKDRVDPVDPAAHLVLDQARLAQARPSYRHLTYLNRQGGYTVPDDLPGVDRPDELDSYYEAHKQWVDAQPDTPGAAISSR